VLLLAGCGGSIHYPKYYSLEIPPVPVKAADDSRFAGTVAIRRFESARYLRRGPIVYRPVPEETGFYQYHRWVTDPAEMVTTAFIDAVRSSRLFSSVQRYDGQNGREYLLFGQVARLEEIDYGGEVRVIAKLSAELINLRTGNTDWTGDADETLRVEERSVNSVVLEMSHAVQKSIDRLITSLDQQALDNVRGSRSPAQTVRPQ